MRLRRGKRKFKPWTMPARRSEGQRIGRRGPWRHFIGLENNLIIASGASEATLVTGASGVTLATEATETNLAALASGASEANLAALATLAIEGI